LVIILVKELEGRDLTKESRPYRVGLHNNWGKGRHRHPRQAKSGNICFRANLHGKLALRLRKKPNPSSGSIVVIEEAYPFQRREPLTVK
jgi:hypothetical protein